MLSPAPIGASRMLTIIRPSTIGASVKLHGRHSVFTASEIWKFQHGSSTRRAVCNVASSQAAVFHSMSAVRR